jgi:hypothetical protein
MTMIVVGSVVGAPGATTTALALARQHDRPVVLLEVDPDGGRLALRLNIDHRPGLIDLLTSARDLPPTELFGWVQRADPSSSAQVVVAHPSGDIVERALRSGVHDLVRVLADTPFDVVCDVGRYRFDSPASPLVAASARRVVVTRGELLEVAVLSHALERLRGLGSVVVAVTGDGPYSAGEVGRALGVPAVGLPAVGVPGPSRRFVRAVDDLRAVSWPGSQP